MANEYSFKQQTCPCGLDLTDKRSAVVGYRRALTPVGECPECGKTLVLDAPALEHPLDEPAIPPPPPRATRSRKAAPEPETEPEAEPEAKTEPEAE